MAKFKSSHLKLKTDQRAYFGDSDQAWFSWTTTSGQGTDLTTNVPIAGEQATASYHLVRYDQFTTLSGFLSDHGNLTGLGDDDHIQYILTDGSRGFTSTVSGVTPVQYYDLATKGYIDDAITSVSGGNFDHGNLTGLGDDDHLQYILVDGTRAFTGTVSGIDPTEDAHLTTKYYVDTAITTATGSLTTDHGSLTGLGDDDHPQYTLVDGSRGFTSTVSGVDPTLDYHLATKGYVDGEITTLSGYLDSQIISDHGNLSGLTDDDHPQYILVDGTRAFTGTVSGIDPTEDAHLTTKFYVDSAITTATGSLTTDHGSLTGLTDDDHPQYILVDGSRGFTSTVSGVAPVQDYDLTTKGYVDGEITTLSGYLDSQIISDHGALTGLTDDDHPQYTLADGTRAFTGTVSGVDPTEDAHLATKYYVDTQLSTISGTKKWGMVSVINGNTSQAVTFDSPFADDNYTLVATLTNEVDSPPSIYSTIQGIKTAGGFTTHFSGEIDSANFILEWFAFYGEQS